MKEVRPSTWILLVVLALFIFAPMFFIDVDGLQGTVGNQGDSTIQPSVPLPPPSNSRPAGNGGNNGCAGNDETEPAANRDPNVVE